MENLWKIAFTALGGLVGWVVAEFRPTFPLILITVIFIVYDAWTAYRLDIRVHESYPEKTDRDRAHFTSFAFGKVVRETIPTRLWLIFLAFLVEHWVFIHIRIPLSYIITGVICFEQAWSILENNASCNESDSKFWKLLQKVLVDKTERHFDLDLNDMREDGEKRPPMPPHRPPRRPRMHNGIDEFENYDNGDTD